MPVHISSRSTTGPVPSFLPLDLTGTHSRIAGDPSAGTSRIHEESIRADLEEPQSPTLPVEIFPRFFHRNSVSTSSDSTHSSPTAAALSTNETPGTSPDTPDCSQSISYPSVSLAMRSGGHSTGEPFSPAIPTTKKARNLKNLAVNTSNASHTGRTISSASLPMSPPSDSPLSSTGPMSSNFMKPLNPPRRRGSALSLTIKTPTAPSFSTPQPIAHPPTTAKLKRPAALRQFQSSPSVPLLTSGLAPEGGMRLPTFVSQFPDIPSEHDETEQSDNYDIPQSREEMPAAYPDGPICIYEPHVYLYLEPTAEQAADYDVIFNVASEVRNPFSSETKSQIPSIDLKDAAEALQNPQSQTENATPDQGKATKGQPEYIHVPWEHNTDIVPDLYDLVKVVDNRVESGKRVLIHCQCGVSRSASLIVAYGIYRNPAVTVQQAYDAVKKRSKWIGPNMNLIMQLQEFRSGLIKSSLNNGAGRSQRQGGKVLHNRNVGEGNSSQVNGISNPFAPQTAPLLQSSNKFAPAPIRTGNLEGISPGPASAPVNFTWPSNQLPSPVQSGNDMVPAPTSYVDAAGQVHDATAIPINSVPAKLDMGSKRSRNAPPPLKVSLSKSADIEPSPRATEFAMTSMKLSNTEPSFGITSPRVGTFGQLSRNIGRIPEPLATPRSTTFAMTALQPVEVTDTATLGLTSPRTSTFGAQLPQRFSSAAVARFGVARPIEDSSTSSSFARGRPNRPVSIAAVNVTGMPSFDALMSPRATEFTRNPIHDALSTSSTRTESAFTDALMSPGAMEFKKDPLHDVFAGGPPTQRIRASTVSTRADPRSPPLRGASPIVRDIFDVL